MKKLTLFSMTLVGALLLGSAIGAPAEAQPATTGHAQGKIELSCTSTATSVSFGFTPTAVMIKNDINSANEVYILMGLGADVTTTTGVRYEPGDGIALGGTPAQWLGVRCITAATETATLYGHVVR